MSRAASDSPTSALSDRDQLSRLGARLRKRGGLHIVLYLGKWKVLDFRIGRLHE